MGRGGFEDATGDVVTMCPKEGDRPDREMPPQKAYSGTRHGDEHSVEIMTELVYARKVGKEQKKEKRFH